MKGFKSVLVFSGNPKMSREEAIEFGRECIQRFNKGEAWALHDAWYLVNVLKVDLDLFADDPVRIASNHFYNRFETLV